MNRLNRERALADPEATFRQPRIVVEHGELSDADKIRILLNWRQDLLEMQTAGAENMPDLSGESQVATRLQAVTDALLALGHESA